MKKILPIATLGALAAIGQAVYAMPSYLVPTLVADDPTEGYIEEIIMPFDNESMTEIVEDMVPEPFRINYFERPDTIPYEIEGIVESDSLYETLPDSVAMLQENLANYARSYLGTPYVWGSKGPKTFDCSGFTTWVFKKHGLDIGHGSRNQATKGKRIDLKDARVGDLMFFTLPREVGSGRVGHVGMVIDVDPESGALKFIHASSKGGVKISNFPDNGPYNRRFLQIRRVIDDDNTSRVLAAK